MKKRSTAQMKSSGLSVLLCALLICALSCNRSRKLAVEQTANPAAPGSIVPNITQTADGRIILSWLEPGQDAFSLRFAIRGPQGWSAPQTIVTRQNFPRYPEAPPWVSMLPSGTLVSLWAEELPSKEKWPGNYLYSAVSRDQGKTWSQPTIVHSDRSNSEHSFASLAAIDENHANIIWLDARDYMSKHTYRLMSAVVSDSGTIEREETMDDDVCTCCPTALARVPAGLIAAYRDHTSAEIRDIYWTRQQAGHWQSSQPIHKDGWHINACPVNGPALAASTNDVVAAWFTGAGEHSALRVAFSGDGGATFQPAFTLGAQQQNSSPLGRPAVALLNSDEALVSWVRHNNGHGELVVVRASRNGASTAPLLVGSADSQGLGYPRMQPFGSAVLLSFGGAGKARKISTVAITAQ